MGTPGCPYASWRCGPARPKYAHEAVSRMVLGAAFDDLMAPTDLEVFGTVFMEIRMVVWCGNILLRSCFLDPE